MDDVHFSSETVEWPTPDWFMERLKSKYTFTLDPCATAENAKCKKFYTIEENGLLQSWKGERVFMNPPFGRDVTGKWVEKAYYEFCTNNVKTVALLPVRTDTRWFHNFIYHKAEIEFIKGRLNFVGGKHGAPFPSMVVVWEKTDNITAPNEGQLNFV